MSSLSKSAESSSPKTAAVLSAATPHNVPVVTPQPNPAFTPVPIAPATTPVVQATTPANQYVIAPATTPLPQATTPNAPPAGTPSPFCTTADPREKSSATSDGIPMQRTQPKTPAGMSNVHTPLQKKATPPQKRATPPRKQATPPKNQATPSREKVSVVSVPATPPYPLGAPSHPQPGAVPQAPPPYSDVISNTQATTTRSKATPTKCDVITAKSQTQNITPPSSYEDFVLKSINSKSSKKKDKNGLLDTSLSSTQFQTKSAFFNEKSKLFADIDDLKLTEYSYYVIKDDFLVRRHVETDELTDKDKASLACFDVMFGRMEENVVDCSESLNHMIGGRHIYIRDAIKAVEQVVAKGIVTQEEVTFSKDVEMLCRSHPRDMITLRSMGNVIRNILDTRGNQKSASN